MIIREALDADWPAIWAVMEPVVRAGETYCWDPGMDAGAGRREWLPGPDGHDPTLKVYVAVEEDGDGAVQGENAVLGSAQLHANRGGNGSHVANASFLVAPSAGGRGIGRALAEHVLAEARSQGYRSMQFNAVVETNTRAVALWRSLGFGIVGTVPEAFDHPDAGPTGLHIMYRRL
jgi:L-amino acid N-acyltransferase YncA